MQLAHEVVPDFEEIAPPIQTGPRPGTRVMRDPRPALSLLSENKNLKEENEALKAKLKHLAAFATHISWCQSLNLRTEAAGPLPKLKCNCGLDE